MQENIRNKEKSSRPFLQPETLIRLCIHFSSVGRAYFWQKANVAFNAKTTAGAVSVQLLNKVKCTA